METMIALFRLAGPHRILVRGFQRFFVASLRDQNNVAMLVRLTEETPSALFHVIPYAQGCRCVFFVFVFGEGATNTGSVFAVRFCHQLVVGRIRLAFLSRRESFAMNHTHTHKRQEC
jgi:hypothetical protein